MHLNGWQRLYCIVVVTWVGYVAYTAYADTTSANLRIVELTAAVERMETQPEADSSLAAAIRHHISGPSSQQLAERYQDQLNAAKDSKTTNIAVAAFLAVVPPIFLYLLIAWVVAGFCRQSPDAS